MPLSGFLHAYAHFVAIVLKREARKRRAGRSGPVPENCLGCAQAVRELWASCGTLPVEMNRVRLAEIAAPSPAKRLPDRAEPAPVFHRDLIPGVTADADVEGTTFGMP